MRIIIIYLWYGVPLRAPLSLSNRIVIWSRREKNRFFLLWKIFLRDIEYLKKNVLLSLDMLKKSLLIIGYFWTISWDHLICRKNGNSIHYGFNSRVNLINMFSYIFSIPFDEKRRRILDEWKRLENEWVESISKNNIFLKIKSRKIVVVLKSFLHCLLEENRAKYDVRPREEQ
jgi:hypothetical protein